MAAGLRSLAQKTWRVFASVETGVVLLLLLVILSAVGTVVLQRPVTRPEEMQSAYSPVALQLLDAVGLTDVFHSWWFLGLVLLVSLCIVASSIDRFPSRWRRFSSAYKHPDEGFRRTLQTQKLLSLECAESDARASQEQGLAAAERALESIGYNPERVTRQDQLGVFAQRHRISELAAYIVHASLLLVFLGTIVDGLWGWRGTLNLREGESSKVIEMRDGKTRTLPFSIRCDGAGEEKYPGGGTKKQWSKVAVVKTGQDVLKKEIVVNDPLVYGGVRFFQSKIGLNGSADGLTLTAGKAGYLAGLEVSYEPGQWAVWSGAVLLGIGLMLAFYVAHTRFWVVPVPDPKSGKLSLWVGGSANRNRDALERRFDRLVARIEEALKPGTQSAPRGKITTVKGK